jgi:mannose-6-phosphate isomerase-like protein (cupin superfamily)
MQGIFYESNAPLHKKYRRRAYTEHMKGFTINIEQITLENTAFRTVLYTAVHSQLVVMCLLPLQDIGEEVHALDQFIRCEQGSGKAILNGVIHDIHAGMSILVPAGARHNIVNTATDVSMKLYTVYAPPNHRDGVVHLTKADAEADTEHFDGVTTE